MRVFLNFVLGGIGLASNLIGGRKASKANAAAAAEEARVAEENAKLVDLQIGDARFRGSREIGDVMRAGREAAGRQRVGAGANYLDTGFGSPLDAIFMTTDNIMRDFETSKRNTQGEITDLERQKLNFNAQAAASRRESANARTAGNIRTIADAASGAADLYKAWITR